MHFARQFQLHLLHHQHQHQVQELQFLHCYPIQHLENLHLEIRQELQSLLNVRLDFFVRLRHQIHQVRQDLNILLEHNQKHHNHHQVLANKMEQDRSRILMPYLRFHYMNMSNYSEFLMLQD